MKNDVDNRAKLKEATKLVERLAIARFPKSEILRVKVSEEIDYDGDDILNVEVVHDSGKEYLIDPKGTLDFSGVLAEELSEIGIEAFPVTYWVSVMDTRMKRKRIGSKGKRAKVAA